MKNVNVTSFNHKNRQSRSSCLFKFELGLKMLVFERGKLPKYLEQTFSYKEESQQQSQPCTYEHKCLKNLLMQLQRLHFKSAYFSFLFFSFFFKDSHIRGIKDQKVRCSVFSLLALLANISTQPNQYQKVSIKLRKNFS